MFGFTKRQVLGLSLIAIPILGMCSFFLLALGIDNFLKLLGMLCISLLIAGSIVTGIDMLNKESQRKLRTRKFHMRG